MSRALQYSDPETFLLATMNDPLTEDKLRVDAAKVLMSFEYKPTDAEILASVRGHHHSMTYVIASRISMAKKQPVYTAFILRRMKAMEKAGLVKRVKSSYQVQLCWSVVEKGGAQ